MKPNEDQIPELLRELKGKGDGFKRPGTNYFEDITERALKDARQPKVVRMTTHRRSYRQWLAYAASLALVLTLAWQFRAQFSNHGEVTASASTSSITLDDLDDAEIMDYIDENLQDFELEQLTDGVELY